MYESSLEHSSNPCPDGYQVSYEPHFEIRAAQLIGDIKVWDEVIRGHEWALTRDPFRGAFFVVSTWMRRLDIEGYIYVLAYSIDLDNCEVRVKELKRLEE